MAELNELARQEGGRYKRRRFLYNKIHSELGKHFIGIIGPRGTGKTILLRQLLQAWDNSFYISLDTVETESPLFEIAKHLKDFF